MLQRTQPVVVTLLLSLLLCLLQLAQTTPAAAQDEAPPATSSPAPVRREKRVLVVRLPDPVVLVHAKQSMAGPRFEVTAGALLTLAAPVLGGALALTAITADTASEQQQAHRMARGVGISMAVVGVFLIANGAGRIHEIRTARRKLQLADASVELAPARAALTLRAMF